MKILLASDCYTYQPGGVSRVVISLARGFRARGHDVKVLAPYPGLKSRKDGDDYYIGSLPAFYYPGQRIAFRLHDPMLMEISEWKPDIIHLHTEGGVAPMVDRIRRGDGTSIPVIMTVHTDYAHFIFGRYRKTFPARLLSRIIGTFMYRRADILVGPSEKVRSFACLEPFLNRIRVIPNGIDLEKWQKVLPEEEKAALFDQYGLKDNGHTMVMVSRISKEKNIQEILRYLPRLLKKQADMQLLIVGDGPFRKELEKICEENRLSAHVRFTGAVPHDQVWRYLAMGDIFVSASTFEVHSIAYLEAMACGLPMLVRKDDSIIGVIEHGRNGFVYRSEKEFCLSVLRMIKNRQLLQNMHEASLDIIKNFTEEKCVDRTLALYDQII